MYNEFILTTYKELSLPGPSKASVSKGPEEESVLMASLGVSQGGVLSNEKKKVEKKSNFHIQPPPPQLEIWKVPQQAQVPSDSELISNHVNYCDPPCDPPLFALIRPLSISCGNKLKPSITRSSYLCRDQTCVIQGSVWK